MPNYWSPSYWPTAPGGVVTLPEPMPTSTIEPALLALMTQVIDYEPLSSRDAYGMPAFGDAVSLPARITATHRRLRDASGSEVIARHVIYTAASGLTPQGRVTLPDGSQPPILDVAQYVDETGAVHHTRLMLG